MCFRNLHSRIITGKLCLRFTVGLLFENHCRKRVAKIFNKYRGFLGSVYKKKLALLY